MTGARDITLHAVALGLAVDADGPLAGVLFLGPSGAGKSSLALGAIDACPWRRTALVADDVVTLALGPAGAVTARGPAALAGLIEARGFGPAPVRAARECTLVAAFDLGRASERVPAASRLEDFGRAGPHLYPFDPAAPAAAARLRATVRSILVDKSNDARTMEGR